MNTSNVSAQFVCLFLYVGNTEILKKFIFLFHSIVKFTIILGVQKDIYSTKETFLEIWFFQTLKKSMYKSLFQRWEVLILKSEYKLVLICFFVNIQFFKHQLLNFISTRNK
jgi:hypothetical protein